MKMLIIFACLVAMVFSACAQKPFPTSASKSTSASRDVTQPVLTVEAQPKKVNDEFIDNTITETERLIQTIGFKPPVKQWADETLADLKKYRLRLKNPTFKSDSLRLDCVMMVHDTISSMNNPNSISLQSQRNVMAILEKTNPGMIGMEGHDVEETTFQSLAESQVLMAKRGGSTLTLADAHRRIDSITLQDGVLMYMKKYPKAKVTGTDPASLIVLSLYISSPEIPDVPAKNASPQLLSKLDANLILLRSYISVIRTLEAAEKKGVKHGSIVIGGSHAKEILEYGKQLGVTLKFYQAIPDSYLKEAPHLNFP